jgi:Ni2+-binding GTPase involved in maturation of urease and hydrogenase
MSTPVKPRYIMIGGFLGAGKTTAIIKFAQHLTRQGRRVGLITNDQSIGLVDTARVRAAGLPVAEITGGCFCCKFNSLVEASAALTAESAPEVLLAEPVGSCTDIKATVSYPLRKLYGDTYHVAPLAVFVDPRRCARILGLTADAGQFSEKVVYVYRKQLEEAEILVINKIDTVTAEFRRTLAAALAQQFPRARVVEVSSATGEGLDALFNLLASGDLGTSLPMHVDYDTYADGEALLGWLNARIALAAAGPFDGNALVMQIARMLRDRLAAAGAEIAHLKLTLMPDEGPDLASLSLTQTAADPLPTHTLQFPLTRGTLLINIRAEISPETLQSEVSQTLATLSHLSPQTLDLAAFRPGRPTPTHRMAAAT